jgi:hypothetical protein
MPHDILNSMRALREELAQRLSLVPEYRALVALDRSIEEICVILQDSDAAMDAQAAFAQQPSSPPQAVAQAQPQARKSAVATAFAETLAAKIDQRVAARAAAFPQAHRA